MCSPLGWFSECSRCASLAAFGDLVDFPRDASSSVSDGHICAQASSGGLGQVFWAKKQRGCQEQVTVSKACLC